MHESIIKDINLAKQGARKIEWVKRNMPILNEIERDFKKNKYFSGMRVSLSIHLEAKTAYLAEIFAAGGAEIAVTGSNPLSTKDDIAAALVEQGISVYAVYDSPREEYFRYLGLTLDIEPNLIIDDGGDLVHLIHTDKRDLIPGVFGACEETTAGLLRDRAREREDLLEFPVIAINDAFCKHLFDNRYGTGQSVWDAVMRTTNLTVSGKHAVIAGYGWCGKGCAKLAKGLGANVTVCEVDPIKALEAIMDGFNVMPMNKAAEFGDIFITVTGCKNVVSNKHFKTMKNGAVIANAGHFSDEIAVYELDKLSVEKRELRDNLTGYKMPDGRWINLLGQGKIVNISCADGHPAEIMDMSFALQLLSARYIVNHYKELDKKIYNVPLDIDEYVADLKLKTLGINIDMLTEEQREYLSGFAHF